MDKVTHAKLKVWFFWPFKGDYWIIDLDPDYQWAVVGVPSRKYLWILSRTPTLDGDRVRRDSPPGYRKRLRPDTLEPDRAATVTTPQS